MAHYNISWLLAVCVGASCIGLAGGCTGEVGGTPQPPPGPTDPEPQQVPSGLTVTPSTSVCTELLGGERLLSVSPEGHAWLGREGDEGVLVRVLDAFGGVMTETATSLDLGEVVEARAWSASDAALISDKALFRIEDFSRVQVSTPEGFLAPASLCGDPTAGGVLVSNGTVYEQRANAWWSWKPSADAADLPSSIVQYDGQCHGSDDIMWLTSESGALYRVTAADYTQPVQFPDLVSVAATEGLVAALVSNRLWTSTSSGQGEQAWQAWTFTGPMPTSIVASGGVLWTVSGPELLRFDGVEWRSVAHEMKEPMAVLAAHESGIWTLGESTVCHATLGETVRIEGLTPYTRSTELDYQLSVIASDGLAPSGSVDDKPFELERDEETAAYIGKARLDTLGWHLVVLETSSARRELWVKRLPEVERTWEADIKPIFEQSCASSTCHHAGSEDPPDLASYEAWTSFAADIRTRVVQGKSMPPPANVGPEWGDDQIVTIQEWLEGGMLP